VGIGGGQMARHVRIRVSGGMYHVFTRGHNREMIFCHERDAEHFLELVQAMRGMFGMRVYAYCLMPNHYHLLLGTPQGNISEGMKWLNGSYGIWFNKKHDRCGHLFGERFHAVLIENGAWLLEASVYVHMNCVATEALGLGKRERKAQRQGLAIPPSQEAVDGRLKVLREFRRSSYRGYAGYEKMPEWLDSGGLLGRAAKDGADASAGYRQIVENRIRQGAEEGSMEKAKWGLVLGGERFARKVRGRLKIGRETSGRRELGRRIDFDGIVRIVERLKKAKWDAFRDKRGDCGRDLVLWAARRFGGMPLKELGQRAGGMDYSAVAVSVLRLLKRSQKDHALRRLMKYVAKQCQK